MNQILAVVEGKRVNRGDTAGEDDGRQVVAPRERGVANGGDIIGKGDGREAA